MAQEYAGKQPQGFKNSVTNVTIVGAGGHVGTFIVESLLKTGNFKITAITRPESTSKVPEGVEVKIINYDYQPSIVEALQGQDVLIITMGVGAPEDQQNKLIDAAAAANVEWILPNEWAHDGTDEEFGKDIMLGPKLAGYRKRIEETGKCSWIGMASSFWYEYSLASGSNTYGFDFKNKSVIFFDDGKTVISHSTWPQCGRAVAGLLSLKVLPDYENDNSPSLAQYRNKFCSFSSFIISQQDIFASVLRVTGDAAEDWKISYEDSKERYRSGVELLQQGNRSGFARLLYARAFYPNRGGSFEATKHLDNDILGLPKEDLDEYTKIAIEKSKTTLQV